MPDFLHEYQQLSDIKSPLKRLKTSVLDKLELRVFIKRDDLIDPALSGNKWRKLQLNLLEAYKQKKKTLVTFGGAYSNHIYAVAAAGLRLGFNTIGIIRGEAPKSEGTTLRYARQCGMSLRFITRTAYRNKELPPDIDLQNGYLIPEGGSNALGIEGCKNIVKELREQLPTTENIDYCCTSSGTGGTASGIIAELNGQSEVLVFSALKGDFLNQSIHSLLLELGAGQYTNWRLMTDYHFGGYAKFKPALIDFINDFRKETMIPLDPVYTGKMLYGIYDLAKKGFFKKGSTIVIVHTGGLQGIEGFNERFGGLLEMDG